MDLYQAAFEGREDDAKFLVKNGGDINMVIMGASDGKHRNLQQWAFENGACILFSFKTSTESSIIEHRYPKNLSMIRGPGEVSKGTFIKS